MNIKILPFFLLILLYLAACKKSAPKPGSNMQTTPPVQMGSLIWAGDKDVVCGMTIDPSTEDTLHYTHKVYGFCSSSCKEKFQNAPAKYALK